MLRMDHSSTVIRWKVLREGSRYVRWTVSGCLQDRLHGNRLRRIICWNNVTCGEGASCRKYGCDGSQCQPSGDCGAPLSFGSD